MSIKPFRATSVVEFDCSPWPEGMACITFGLLFAVIMSLYFIINGVKTAFGAVLVYAIAAALTGYGVYLWRFRRKPFRRKVNLGGMQHRLYLHNRWLFIVFELALTFLIFVVSFSVATLVFDGIDGFADELKHKLRGWGWLSIAFCYKIVHDYLSYYTYLRSPVETRKKIA